ncbi:zinc finger protein 366 isoform X2 [Protopterus annectens]|uniref:zinc finger protein 366 isoform X2 n=1 Tax=Protopterus annectens TaxID=7888 RepID=UPI001CFBE909|nr:zinc finger protein 366 isoform X2 [Protopterus annectens]
MQKEANWTEASKGGSHIMEIFKSVPSVPHCLQPVTLGMMPRRFPPFTHSYGARFAHLQYNYNLHHFHHYPGDFARLYAALNGGPRKRKSLPTKVYHTEHPEGGEVNPDQVQEDKTRDSSSNPSLFSRHSAKCDSEMIDLSNNCFQLYKAFDHFGSKHIKQEPIKHDVMWSSPAFMQPSYSYYPKVHPGLIFPYMMPQPDLHGKHQFETKGSTDQSSRDPDSKATEQSQQKVERVDVNTQIDDSYYIDVGGDQKRWQCRLCEKSYTSKYNLVTHILGHSGIKPYSCSHCGKLFKQLSHLHTHMLTHQGSRPHKCQVCQKAFTQTSHLKRHMMQHSDVKPYTCGICGRGFAYPSELKAHESKHEVGRENICIECGLDFPTLAQLKRHLTSHRGPTQYNCTECNKTFQYPSQLQNHMMKHKDIRPYICTECGMEFIQPHHLKQHSLTHKLCGKEFNRMHNLMGHMHLHSDSKPFKCLYCPSKFTLKGNLTRHMKVKHGVMEGTFSSKGSGRRGRIRMTHTDTISHMNQEEPFDLSQKNREKCRSAHYSGERVIPSTCQQDGEDHNCKDDHHYLEEHYHGNKFYLPEDLSCRAVRTPMYFQDLEVMSEKNDGKGISVEEVEAEQQKSDCFSEEEEEEKNASNDYEERTAEDKIFDEKHSTERCSKFFLERDMLPSLKTRMYM